MKIKIKNKKLKKKTFTSERRTSPVFLFGVA